MGLAREPQNTRGFPEEVDVFLKDGEYPMYVVIHEDFCRSGCPRYINPINPLKSMDSP